MANKDKKKKDNLSGPQKGDFIAVDESLMEEEITSQSLPQQDEFWRPPVRFGTVPVEKEPLGWDRRRGFRKLFPAVMLPTQVVERVSFGHPELEPNRLYWGDNLHIMRQLPSESIDLIYIDPPFFSGRQYNVIFGDQNELRSFSDIWEGGMPGYLIWLNARLYEMKRLLKKTGTIYVHCDWHASHYIKVEMDKIFGNKCFVNEIIWKYSWGVHTDKRWNRKHDTLFMYCKSDELTFNAKNVMDKREDEVLRRLSTGLASATMAADRSKHRDKTLKLPSDVWNIPTINAMAAERIGYPTQKPKALLERIISASSNEGDIVADFYCGGGTTAEIAQKLGRRWIVGDQSRVAIAITADRISKLVEEEIGKMFPVPDFTVEHWGIYEAKRLSQTPTAQFRNFVLRAFGANPDDSQVGIRGMKGAIPVWVGDPDQRSSVTAKEVEDFANAIRKTVRYQQDNLRDGIMLAWAFRPDAVSAAEKLRQLENTELNFVRLEQIRIDSPRFREQVAALSTDHADYENFLTFVQPPRVEVGWKRITTKNYKFDVSETAVMNPGAKLINVQWDFNYEDRFSSTQGYSFLRSKKNQPVFQTQFEFAQKGKFRIACKVQDDMGGEGIWIGEIEVT